MKDREISREEAIKRLEEGAPFSELYDSRWEDALALAIKALKAEPVRHGHWNEAKDGTLWCSVCISTAPYEEDYYGYVINAPHYDYCPHCGAIMDESTMGQVKPSDGERKEDDEIQHP